MPITIVSLDLNYLRLRYHLEQEGYRLQTPTPDQQQARAAEIGRSVCADCNNWLQYQTWAKEGSVRALAVCMECYMATEL